MSPVLYIAADEWRLWRRSRLALMALLVFAAVLAVTSVISALQMEQARESRAAQQLAAETRFREQPARHPHRMVHYGHYVFRTPPPLALFDPGVDAVTGQSLFLEGHRQNAEMFADARSAPAVGGLGRLDPALVYQLLLPLLLIALGHGAVLREREARTLPALLAQGLPGTSLFLGKLLAMSSLVLVMLLPAAVLGLVAVLRGEGLAAVCSMLGLYGGYLMLWATLITVVSMRITQRGLALGCLILAWLLWALLLPRLAVGYAAAAEPLAGKLHADLVMLEEQRSLGDGHNANDPAFAALRDGLLAEYGVERVEDLPINFRGVVAGHAEAKLTALMNAHAEQRMAREQVQLARLAQFAWLSPTLATGLASRTLAGTGLDAHQRFLREAEALRFEFVQALNHAHAHALRYTDDISRGSDPEAERRTRIDPQHWRQLGEFRFSPEPAAARLDGAGRLALPVFAWLALLIAIGLVLARRLQP